ncbi:hypothetical protein BJX99DRAFT_264402 [Aspergillus californicus]
MLPPFPAAGACAAVPLCLPGGPFCVLCLELACAAVSLPAALALHAFPPFSPISPGTLSPALGASPSPAPAENAAAGGSDDPPAADAALGSAALPASAPAPAAADTIMSDDSDSAWESDDSHAEEEEMPLAALAAAAMFAPPPWPPYIPAPAITHVVRGVTYTMPNIWRALVARGVINPGPPPAPLGTHRRNWDRECPAREATIEEWAQA